jgi:hypothetical protein
MELLAQDGLIPGATGDTAEIVMFWVFAVMALGAGIAVISMRNIVHGALMLVVNLLAVAGLYVTLESPFLGIIQVLVYGGAIMVLFLFVIMLLGVSTATTCCAPPTCPPGSCRGGRRPAGRCAAVRLRGPLHLRRVGVRDRGGDRRRHPLRRARRGRRGARAGLGRPAG